MPPDHYAHRVRHFLENGVKALLTDVRNVRDLFRLAEVACADLIDPTRAELKSQTFVRSDSRHVASDVAMRVSLMTDHARSPGTDDLPDDTWCWIYILIEHQDRPDPTMPLRLLDYVVQVYRLQTRAWEDRHGRGVSPEYEPVLPVVMYTGERRWESPGILADLTRPRGAFDAFIPHLEPIYIDIGATPIAQFHERGGWLGRLLPLIASRRAPTRALSHTVARVFRDLRPIAEDAHERGRWLDFLAFALTLIYNGRPAEEHADLTRAIADATGANPWRNEVHQMSKTYAEVLEERAEARGKAEGALESARATLHRLAEIRFGPLPDAIRQTIDAADLDQLNAWLDRVVTATILDDLGIE